MLSSLAIQSEKDGVAIDNATGVRIRQGDFADYVVMAGNAGPRNYGPLSTDAEAAYVRVDKGQVVEVGMVSGRKLVYEGQTMVELEPGIVSLHLRYAPSTIVADVRGTGKLSVAACSAKTIVFNDTVDSGEQSASLRNGRWEVDISNPGPLELDSPTFSTDPNEVYRAYVGFRPSPTALPPWNPVLVTWKTSALSDAIVEYAPMKSDHWLRNVKPDAVTDHRMVLTRLTPGTTYRVRIQSATDDGRIGTAELSYRCPDLIPE